MAVRHAQAEWSGTVREGSGRISVDSGTLSAPYSFGSRMESGQGTNPEELLGAAHAGCFTMALSAALNRAGFTAGQIRTSAAVHLAAQAGAFTIPRIELDTEATVPGIAAEKFQEIANDAKQNCPVSKALASVSISLTARLL